MIITTINMFMLSSAEGIISIIIRSSKVRMMMLFVLILLYSSSILIWWCMMLSFCITIIIVYVGLAPHPSSYIGHKYNQQWWKTECKFGDKCQTRRPRAIASTDFIQNAHSIGIQRATPPLKTNRFASPTKPL